MLYTLVINELLIVKLQMIFKIYKCITKHFIIC